MNEAISDYSESEGSDYVPFEDENFESELSEFIDSENDVNDAVEEDCDVNVNQSVQANLGFVSNITCDNDDVDSEDDLDSLYIVSSDDSGSRRKNRFPEFNSELNMAYPVLRKKLVFTDKEILKEVVRQYGRVHRFSMSFKKNDNKRVQADFNYSIVSLQQDIREAYGEVYVYLPKCTRARKLARETVLGSYKDQYGKIYEYLGEVRHSNSGTTTICKLDNRLFVRMYACYEGCKLGFKYHCMPFISIDRCFLKGYILVATGIDADNCIYPIAVVVVEAET
ncbi:hypothetical protein V6N13_006241 [Hibiscus sabdariffa]